MLSFLLAWDKCEGVRKERVLRSHLISKTEVEAPLKVVSSQSGTGRPKLKASTIWTLKRVSHLKFQLRFVKVPLKMELEFLRQSLKWRLKRSEWRRNLTFLRKAISSQEFGKTSSLSGARVKELLIAKKGLLRLQVKSENTTSVLKEVLTS